MTKGVLQLLPDIVFTVEKVWGLVIKARPNTRSKCRSEGLSGLDVRSCARGFCMLREPQSPILVLDFHLSVFQFIKEELARNEEIEPGPGEVIRA